MNRDGTDTVRQDVSTGGDALVSARDLHARRVEVPVSGSLGVQAGQGNVQVNLYAFDAPPVAGVGADGRAGRLLGELDPFILEVHRPVQPHRTVPGLDALPRYQERDHDRQLVALALAAAGGSSGIAVLVGGSSTGKTRACWEVLGLLRDREPQWRLWHPIAPSHPQAALAELPMVGPRTVIWLNGAQRYLGAPNGLGEQVAAGLRDLLRDRERSPVLILATLWPEHWSALAVRPRQGQEDRHAAARDLLSGHEISVPGAFGAELARELAGSPDPRLAAAAQALHGEVTQFLAGAPALLDYYRHAPPAARAVLDAAIDARRLGMSAGLPRDFLHDAATGYLTDTQWATLGRDWSERFRAALEEAALERKGTRGPLTAVLPRPGDTASNPGQTFRLADYLEQHGRSARSGAIPPGAFWNAALRHASSGDLNALASAAERRGLLRDAARLRKRAIACGDSSTAAAFIHRWHALHPADPNAAWWIIGKVSLGQSSVIADLLGALHATGAGEQVKALLARDPAAHASLDNPSHVAALLGALRYAEAAEQVKALLARDPAAHVSVDDSFYAAELLEALRTAGLDEQAAVLANRAAAQASLDSMSDAVWLLRELDAAGQRASIQTLARRAAAHVTLDNPYEFAELLEVLQEVDADEQMTALLARNPAAHVPLDDPLGVGKLLGMLLAVGAFEQNSALLARDPAAHIILDDPLYLAELLKLLWDRGEERQVRVLLARDPAAHVTLADPDGIAELLRTLHGDGADEQVRTLLARHLAANVTLDGAHYVAGLLEALREVGAHEQARLLATRLPAEGHFHLLLNETKQEKLYKFGREPDGSPARPWNWDDLN